MPTKAQLLEQLKAVTKEPLTKEVARLKIENLGLKKKLLRSQEESIRSDQDFRKDIARVELDLEKSKLDLNSSKNLNLRYYRMIPWYKKFFYGV